MKKFFEKWYVLFMLLRIARHNKIRRKFEKMYDDVFEDYGEALEYMTLEKCYERDNKLYKKSKELKKFEEILIDLNKTYMERYKVNLYEVYKLYFLEGKSFGEIIKITDIYDNHGVTKALDIIFFSFNTYIVTIGEKEQLNLEELTYNS